MGIAREDLVDAHSFGEVSHLALAIARNQQDALNVVIGSEVCDERSAVFAWSVVEPVRR